MREQTRGTHLKRCRKKLDDVVGESALAHAEEEPRVELVSLLLDSLALLFRLSLLGHRRHPQAAPLVPFSQRISRAEDVDGLGDKRVLPHAHRAFHL